MTLTDRQCLHTTRMGKTIVYADVVGLKIKVVEWNRLLSTQKEYVAKGVSKTLNSRHLENCATDIVIIAADGTPTAKLEEYRILGLHWESLGGRWGGRFVDKEAFRKKEGREFDPSRDLGWDIFHYESVDA